MARGNRANYFQTLAGLTTSAGNGIPNIMLRDLARTGVVIGRCRVACSQVKIRIKLLLNGSLIQSLRPILRPRTGRNLYQINTLSICLKIGQ